MSNDKSKQRMDFLDILKGIACIWMIHRHVWNALIDPNQKIPSYYPAFLIGLAAPCFLIGAGFIFIILFQSAKEKNQVNKRMKRLIYRSSQVILLGYFLQLPYYSIRKILFSLNRAEKETLFHANVLQCIGISLILLAIFVYFLKRFNTIYIGYISGIVGLIIIFITPWVWKHADFPIWIQSYFSFKTKSLFPFFPFGGILFIGAAAASFYIQMKSRNKTELAFLIFGIIGLLLMITRPINTLQMLFWQYKNANPLIYLYKVGQGLLALYISYLLEKIPGILKKIVDWLTLMGKEALFVYAFHLIIIYGSPLSKGLYKAYKKSLDLTTILLLGLGIILLNIIGAHLWSKIKEKWLIILRILFAIAFLIFLIKPY